MAKKKIALIGYFGRGNLGDDMMLKCYLARNTQSEFLILNFGNKVINPAMSNIVLDGSRLINFIKLFYYLIQISELRWIGGTCFSDNDGIGGYRYMKLALMMGKEISYHRIGINNIKQKRNIYKSKFLLKRAKTISVRDYQSKINLKKLVNNLDKDINVLPDYSVEYFENNRQKNSKNNQYDVLIAWRDLTSYNSNHQDLTEKLILYICKITDIKEKIAIITTDDTVDYEVSNKIFLELSQTGRNVHLRSGNLEEKLNLIKISKKIITARLHVAIVARFLGKSCEVYPYSEKIYYQGDIYKFNYMRLS